MKYPRSFFFWLLWILLTIEPAGLASHVADPAPSPAPDSGARNEAPNKLSDKEFAILRDGFNANEDFIRLEFDEKLPKALETARTAKQEDDVAGIIAKLLGTVNNTQLNNVFNEVVKEAKALQNGSSRYAELLKRLEWTKEIFMPSPSGTPLPFPTFGEEFERFRTALQGKFADVRRTNAEFYALLNDALGDGPGKQAAIDRLRAYNPKMLFAFLEGQAKSGNAALANRLGQALAFSENGRNFLDGVDKDGKTVRIHAEGNNFAGAVTGFARENGPAAKLTFSPTRHAGTPQVSFDARTGVTTREAGSPAPPGPVISPIPVVPAPLPKDTAAKEKEKEKDVGTKEKTEDPPPTTGLTLTEAVGMINAKCQTCHSSDEPKGSNVRSFGYSTAQLTAMEPGVLSQIKDAINRPNNPMPLGMSPHYRDTDEGRRLLEWLDRNSR